MQLPQFRVRQFEYYYFSGQKTLNVLAKNLKCGVEAKECKYDKHNKIITSSLVLWTPMLICKKGEHLEIVVINKIKHACCTCSMHQTEGKEKFKKKINNSLQSNNAAPTKPTKPTKPPTTSKFIELNLELISYFTFNPNSHNNSHK